MPSTQAVAPSLQPKAGILRLLGYLDIFDSDKYHPLRQGNFIVIRKSWRTPMQIVRHRRITYYSTTHFHHTQDLSLTTVLQREKAKAIDADLSNPPSEGR